MSLVANLMPKKPKILVAEDEPSLCRYIQTLMSQWECELLIEPTAEGAIQRAATFKPDVALLGLTPGMDRARAGIGLLEVSPGTQIVLWNESVPRHVLSDLRAQGYDFRTLAAPFSGEELRAVCFPRTSWASETRQKHLF